MKKIFMLIISALIICPSAFSAIVEGKTSDVDVLRNTTYSESMIKTIDTIKTFNTYGVNPYTSKYAYNTDPNNPSKHFFHWYKKMRNWMDPAQDDGYFGMHEINFNNRFFLMQPSQSVFDKDSEEYSYRARSRFKLDNIEDL